MPIPSLETERLVLRPMTMEDWPRYCELMTSVRAVYMGGPHSEWNAWALFCQDIAQWQLFGHGALMFDDKKTGICLGQVCINHGPLFPEKEIGWYVYPEAEGKGYAAEAAVALRRWAFESLGLESLVSYMDADNARSIALAKKLGAVLDETASKPDPEDLVYRHTKTSS